MTEFSEISAEAVLADAGRSLADRYRALLLEDCVPFWFPRSVDVQHGG
ncbi:MAG: hypothetical protein RLZZ232_1472, partial [Planctomycetota bacterium]